MPHAPPPPLPTATVLLSVVMAPPLDKPSPTVLELEAGQAWLDALNAQTDATTPAAWAEIDRREALIDHAIAEIDAGRHPLCLAPTAT